MNIILHGFGANKDTSSTVQALLSHIPDSIGMSYQYWDADAAAKSLVEQIDKFDHPVTIIGVSLGGFWARYVSAKCPNVERLILLNPSLNAHTSATKYENKVVNGQTIKPGYGDSLSQYRIVKDDPELPIHIVVTLDDDTVDPQPTIAEMEDRAQMLILNAGGHRINCNQQHIIDFINKAINTIYG